MKRLMICLHLLLILIFVLPVSSLATNTPEYQLSELGLTISMPSSYIVFTRNITMDDSDLLSFGLTQEGLLTFMNENNVYLDGISKDATREITVTMTENKMEDFSLKSDEELLSLPPTFEETFSNLGLTMQSYDVYNHVKTKFLKIQGQYMLGEAAAYSLQYFTVNNGKLITITLHNYSNDISSSDKDDLLSVVDSVVFDTAPQTIEVDITPETSSIYTDADINASGANTDTLANHFIIANLLISLLITVTVYTLPIVIYRFAIRKAPVNKKKAKKITIIYGLCSLFVMSFFLYFSSGERAGGSIILWSYINYLVLTSDKHRKSNTSEPQTEAKAEESVEASATADPVIILPSSTDLWDDDFAANDYESNTNPNKNDVHSSSSQNCIRRCESCGNALSDNAVYCSQCGTLVAGEQENQ